MDNTGYRKVILLCLILVVGFCFSGVLAQESKSEAGLGEIVGVGRDNPFERIPRRRQLAVASAAEISEADEFAPELYVETVTIKYLDAQSLKPVIERMNSDDGSIAVDVKTNSLIICDTRENLDMILARIEQADRVTAPRQVVTEKPKPELFVETVTLKFLDAKNLMKVIKQMSSDYGSISVDTKSNSLIICDTKENLEMILAEIDKGDQTPQQIMVEVVILDVQLNDDTEIGINWDFLSSTRHSATYRQNFTSSRLGSTAKSETTQGLATAFNTTGLGGDFSIITGTIRNVVHLIQQKRDVEIIASPRVMMVSGQSAFIEAVEELPYTEISSSTGGGALETTEFKDVGVKLNVSATLVEGNEIFLTVESTQNVATGESDTEVPIVDTRKAKTSLLLTDGQVVILGGLRRREKTKEVDQIPLLGDLPIIGELFKSTNTIIKNSELVVFLSPHIYKGEQIPDEEMAKYNEITDRPLLSLPDDDDDDE